MRATLNALFGIGAADSSSGRRLGFGELFMKRAFQTTSVTQQMRRTRDGPALAKCLGPFDLIMMGIGGIVGAGVFVLTGVAAQKHAGCAPPLRRAL